MTNYSLLAVEIGLFHAVSCQEQMKSKGSKWQTGNGKRGKVQFSSVPVSSTLLLVVDLGFSREVTA